MKAAYYLFACIFSLVTQLLLTPTPALAKNNCETNVSQTNPAIGIGGTGIHADQGIGGTGHPEKGIGDTGGKLVEEGGRRNRNHRHHHWFC